MRLVILSLFIAVPLIEIAVFIQVGGLIGLWPTIALVLVTAVVGTSLLRAQGLATLSRAQASMQRGEMPLREVFDGACLLVAGVLLLTPGFVTDAMGLLLFLPPVRAGLLGWLGNAVKAGKIHVETINTGWGPPPPHGPHGPHSPAGAQDIEGEYRDVTPEDVSPEDVSPQRDQKRLDRD